MHDLVNDPQYAAVKTEMIAKLKAEQKRLGDPLDIDAPPKIAPGNSY